MKLALYQPDIAQNLGAAIRLCACFNVELHVIEPCGFPLSDKAIKRTAMDYGQSAHLARHASWDQFVESDFGGESEGDSEVASRLVLFTTRGATPLQDFIFLPQDILLFGRESAGVPEPVHQRADARVIIPISPDTRSLNLVSAASIGLFEALRQTTKWEPT